MLAFDRKGPEGQGSQTGRKLGRCNLNATQSKEQDASDEILRKPGSQRGRGKGRGFGFGRGKGQGRGLVNPNS